MLYYTGFTVVHKRSLVQCDSFTPRETLMSAITRKSLFGNRSVCVKTRKLDVHIVYILQLQII